MNEISCTFCGSPFIEWITKYEDPDDGPYYECCTCGHIFDEPEENEHI
jgi:DNA-directed RNA polymerase subunit RPC12/RpoP